MDYNLGPAQGRPPVRFEDLDEDARSKVTRILIDAVKEHQSVIDALRLPGTLVSVRLGLADIGSVALKCASV